MKRMFVVVVLAMILLVPVTIFAQSGTIAGQVVIAKTGDPLANAAVFLSDSKTGTYSKKNGQFMLKSVPVGTHKITASFMGYAKQTQEINVAADQTTVVKFEMVVESIGIEGIKVVSERATERVTPVAFTDVDKEEMDTRLGSRDIPLVLTTTPSVYSTDTGGGSGDARVNVRGFDQRNVAIMINGVPVNDMENGWVYWSNWDGIGDATSSIQMQRGLSAVNLATPSIGGTMNIITDPTSLKPGIKFKQEYGLYGFKKSTLMVNSGLINDKFAVSAGGVRKEGEGFVDAAWTDAWAYYMSAGWNVNDRNKLELYVVGAPQRHGQNLYMQNIAVYSHDYAEDLDDYDTSPDDDGDLAFDKYQERGFQFNQNWSPVSYNYQGSQYWDGERRERYDKTFLNERENFYHKPQINLNWYTDINEKLNLYSILYYSGGKGGGTGTFGDVYTRDAFGKLGDDDWRYYFGPSPWYRDWDATIAMNSGPAGSYWVDQDSLYKEEGESLGILRNSVNQQWTIGAISKAYYTVNDNFKTSVGLDWRMAEIDHFREVRDLLGGRYFHFDGNDFDTTADDYQKVLGDKIDYYNTNSVDWIGGYWQGEYSINALRAFLMGGYSMISYTYTDHFKTEIPGDISSGELTTESGWLDGYQTKGGISYILNEYFDIYSNAGYVSKCPIFDEVINDWTGEKFDNPKNENFISLEAGVNFNGLDGKLTTRANLYVTDRKDESLTFEHDTQDGDEIKLFVKGLDSRHMGVELEASYMPVELVRFDAAFAKGDWKYLNNVEDTEYETPSGAIESIDIYVDDLKVGDAPQMQMSLGTSVYPYNGLMAQLVIQYFADHYSAWDPFTRTDPTDKKQSWEIPAYSKFDLHVSYDLPLNLKGIKAGLFAHIFNVLDEVYIQDATDNSQYNAWDHDHDADDAEVFFGAPRTFNAGIQVMF